LLQRIESAARAGFRAIEMHFPYDVPPTDVAATARRHGLELLGINTSPGDFNGGERGLGALPGRERDFQAAVDQSNEGEIAYPAIFAAVDAIGYQGWVGCEYRPRGDTDEGLRWTRPLGITL
jgi:hydroxypyruvate isomerase